MSREAIEVGAFTWGRILRLLTILFLGVTNPAAKSDLDSPADCR
jgi:hypothetical protein